MRQSPFLIFIKFGLFRDMPKEYTTTAVAREAKKVLEALKAEMGARNYDQVVLLWRAGYAVP